LSLTGRVDDERVYSSDDHVDDFIWKNNERRAFINDVVDCFSRNAAQKRKNRQFSKCNDDNTLQTHQFNTTPAPHDTLHTSKGAPPPPPPPPSPPPPLPPQQQHPPVLDQLYIYLDTKIYARARAPRKKSNSFSPLPLYCCVVRAEQHRAHDRRRPCLGLPDRPCAYRHVVRVNPRRVCVCVCVFTKSTIVGAREKIVRRTPRTPRGRNTRASVDRVH